MVRVDDDAGHAGRAQAVEDVGERGAVADRHERLGADVGQGPQARTQAGGEDHRRKHGTKPIAEPARSWRPGAGDRRVGRTAGRVVGACPCAAAPSCVVLGPAALALAVVAMACGSSAVGVDTCKSIEEARCNQLPNCPNVQVSPPIWYTNGTAVQACVRYYDTACGHGLSTGTDPGTTAVNACVERDQRERLRRRRRAARPIRRARGSSRLPRQTPATAGMPRTATPRDSADGE